VTRRPDLPTLVAGVGLVALGALVALDRIGELDLRFGVYAPVVCAILGLVLLVTGLTRSR
jgi:hypothetical protein